MSFWSGQYPRESFARVQSHPVFRAQKWHSAKRRNTTLLEEAYCADRLRCRSRLFALPGWLSKESDTFLVPSSLQWALSPGLVSAQLCFAQTASGSTQIETAFA